MDRMVVLRQYCEALRTVPLDDDRRFHELVRAGIEHLNLSDEKFSRQYGISRTSVNRWKHGRNTPLARTRRQVYDFLKGETEEAIKTLEGLRRSEAEYKRTYEVELNLRRLP